MIERRTVFRAALAAGASGLVAACAGGGSDEDAAPEPPPVAKVSAEPAVGATDVGVTDEVTVQVERGTLAEVALTNPDGDEVPGKLAEDNLSWSSAEPLGFGTTYTYSAKAIGSDNKAVEFTGTFDTVKPASEVRATLYPGDDAEVGVGMPVSVKFSAPVTDRAAAEKALTVTTPNDVEGSWAWLHDRQVDWRPKEYWPTGTKVTVAAKLYGVHYGGGNYGRADVTTDFVIGRNQVVKIHTPDHRMRVYREGSLYADYPCSNGKDADPELNTPNGTVIVMTKEPTSIFDNERYGYTDLEKKWCCRISNHGEYIHENEENRANIGKRNTSHGCVNLFENDAKAYFDSAMLGDPVEVTGSQVGFPTTSDVMDWLIDWDQWQSMSALR
ncbi:MAG: L,D-transpeptidase [Haloechinothrix sp.]